MHGYKHAWWAWVVAAAGVCGWVGVAMAQQVAAPMPGYDPAYPVPVATRLPDTQAPPPGACLVSGSNPDAAEPSLADKVAVLEKELKRVKDKEAEAKQKAAGKMSAEVTGRMFLDGAAFDQGPLSRTNLGDQQNGVELRAAWIGVQGKGFDVFDYKIEYDFGSRTDAKAKDIYLQVNELPWLGHVRIGHFKEPYSLDELCSMKYITFMERSAPGRMLAPVRHFGIMAHNCTESENATWAIGGFAEKDDDGAKIQNDKFGGSLTMRATWLPWYDEATEGRGLLHTGIAYSYRKVFNDVETYKSRPECDLFNAFTYNLAADNVNLLGAEMAWVYGPLSVQSELFLSFLDRIDAPDADIKGGYINVSYFLTGEHRPYRRSMGVFDRVKPIENFFRVRDEDGYVHTGNGAWELKYRYSYVDMFDGGRLGLDQIGDHTVGLNWYLSPYARLMLEYIYSDFDHAGGTLPGTLSIFQMRTQFDF